MGNDPVQAVSSISADKKPESAPVSASQLPGWLEGTSLNEEPSKPVEVVVTGAVETISDEPIGTTIRVGETDTIAPTPEPSAKVADKADRGTPIKTVAPDASPDTRIASLVEGEFLEKEKEEKEKSAHAEPK